MADGIPQPQRQRHEQSQTTRRKKLSGRWVKVKSARRKSREARKNGGRQEDSHFIFLVTRRVRATDSDLQLTWIATLNIDLRVLVAVELAFVTSSRSIFDQNTQLASTFALPLAGQPLGFAIRDGFGCLAKPFDGIFAIERVSRDVFLGADAILDVDFHFSGHRLWSKQKTKCHKRNNCHNRLFHGVSPILF